MTTGIGYILWALIWLRTCTCQAVTSHFCANDQCQLTWTPYDNMVAGLVGYDPVLGDPFSDNGDPGLKKQIFLPTYEAERKNGGASMDMQPFIHAQDDVRCTATLTTRKISTFADYESYKTGAFSSEDWSTETTTVNLLFWKSQSSSSSFRSSNTENQKLRKFFSDTQGEIYITEATCQMYTMEIDAFSKLAFHPGFVNALRGLQFASTNPNSQLSNKIFKNFLKSFGSFYVDQVTMGAKFWIETRFASYSSGESTSQARMECIHNSFRKGHSSGFETPPIKSVEAKGVKIETDFQTLKLGSDSGSGSTTNRCSGDSSSNNYFAENSLRSTVVHSIGSKSFDDLTNWINDEFTPVPIKYHISPMNNLLKPFWEAFTPGGNLGDIPFKVDDPSGEKLNSTKINNFFLEKVKQYCKIILGKGNCPSYDVTGCGIAGYCRQENEVCYNVPTTTSKLGFVCACPCNICGHCSRDTEREKQLVGAAYAGNLAEVKQLLLNTFVDSDDNRYGLTPLMEAAYGGHKQIVQLLLDNGAEIDHQSNRLNRETALIRAAGNSHKDVVRLLLNRGANTKLKATFGSTACRWNDRVGNIIPSCN